MRSNNTERLVEFHNGELGYYIKRGYERYEAKDYGHRNT